MASACAEAPAANGTLIECAVRGGFAQWLCGFGGAVVVTTYQAGKVVMISWDGRRMCALFRQLDKPMGLAIHGQKMAIVARNKIHTFVNVPQLGQGYPGKDSDAPDACYVPRTTYYLGDIDAHDLAYGADGLVFTSSRLGCIAKVSEELGFVPLWSPKFITALKADDRCHLNGMAMLDGKPKYVLALGETNTPGGWRAGKAAGGVVIDVDTNEVVKRGLSMPHSPRLYDGKLWLANSGTGELWRIDTKTFEHEVVCQCQGYLRGLCLVGNYAIVGLCQIRERHMFGGLPVQERCKNLLCGVSVIDLRTGVQIGMLEFTAGCQELYDVDVIPGVGSPMILSMESPEAGRALSIPAVTCWMEPK